MNLSSKSNYFREQILRMKLAKEKQIPGLAQNAPKTPFTQRRIDAMSEGWDLGVAEILKFSCNSIFLTHECCLVIPFCRMDLSSQMMPL